MRSADHVTSVQKHQNRRKRVLSLILHGFRISETADLQERLVDQERRSEENA